MYTKRLTKFIQYGIVHIVIVTAAVTHKLYNHFPSQKGSPRQTCGPKLFPRFYRGHVVHKRHFASLTLSWWNNDEHIASAAARGESDEASPQERLPVGWSSGAVGGRSSGFVREADDPQSVPWSFDQTSVASHWEKHLPGQSTLPGNRITVALSRLAA